MAISNSDNPIVGLYLDCSTMTSCGQFFKRTLGKKIQSRAKDHAFNASGAHYGELLGRVWPPLAANFRVPPKPPPSALVAAVTHGVVCGYDVAWQQLWCSCWRQWSVSILLSWR